MRQSISHINTPKALRELKAQGDRVLASVTEKTDGSFFRLSYAGGHYWCETQGCGPFNIFYDSILEWAEEKFGERFNPDVMRPFEEFRLALRQSEMLLDTLKNVKFISGEMISSLARPHDDDHVCPIGTAYSRKHLGATGLFILHRHSNPWLTSVPYDARWLSTDDIKVDDDWSAPIEFTTAVDTPDELYEALSQQLMTRTGKWGLEVEGYVIHTPDGSYKWIHPEWKTRKDQRWQKSI